MGRFGKSEFLEQKTEPLEYLPTILYLCPSKRHPLPPCEIYIYIYIYIGPLKGHYSYLWGVFGVGRGDFPTPPKIPLGKGCIRLPTP